MLGKIVSYDSLNELGYIEGYDEVRYFYHQINVKKGEILKKGDIVNFDYLLEQNENQLPYAINIEKETLNQKSKPYRELYEIFKYLPESEKEKISKKFLKEIEEKMDTCYEYKIEHFEDFEKQKMMEETRILLAVVYRDYLATEEEKREILQKEKEERDNEEKEKKEKYNPDNIFKDRKPIVKEMSLTEIKEKKWFEKVVDFFKKLFKR